MAKTQDRVGDTVEKKAIDIYCRLHGHKRNQREDATLEFHCQDPALAEGFHKLARAWIKTEKLVAALVSANRKLRNKLKEAA
jgi:hypothetical protein